MTTKKTSTSKKRYKLEPPDGGYGYMVLAAVTVFFAAIGMFYVCFTMIFNDVFIELGMNSTDISLVMGLFALGLAVSGYVTGPLLKIMTRRKLACVGALFLNASYYGTVFVKTKAEFVICQGVLKVIIKSIGTGLLFNVGCSAVNDYFLKKRLFALSFALSAAAIGTMLAPMLVAYCNKHYGIQGTLIVITAICMQTFVAAALLQPVAWHMKKVQLNDNAPDTRLLLEDTISEEPKIDHSHSSKAKSCLDWPLLKRFGLTCVCLGAPISIFADYTFVNFLAPALYEYHWNNDQVKWAYSMLGFGDITARFFIILTSTWLKKISSHLIYIVGLLIAIATKSGVIRDATGNYMLVFLIVVGVMVGITCVWSIELLGSWRRKVPSETGLVRNRALNITWLPEEQKFLATPS